MPFRIKFRIYLVIAVGTFFLVYLLVRGLWERNSLFFIITFFLIGFSAILIYLFVPQIKIGNEIKTGKKGRVYLTFDDGPIEPYTSHILDILKATNVKATFFVVGRKAKEYPHLVKRIHEEGHLIGNHTLNHTILTWCSPKTIEKEIKDCEQIIYGITREKPTFFRAPHGFRSPFLRRILKKHNYIPVTWTKGIWDTSPSHPSTLLKRVVTNIREGEILLLHDGNPFSYQTVEILPKIIEEYRKRGLKFEIIKDAV